MLAEMGLSISYDRLRTFSIDIANSVIEHWNKEGVVVPPQAVKGVFTTGNTDNVDWNPTSTTCKPESILHGTCWGILQHFPENDQDTTYVPDILNPEVMGKTSVMPLPISYTNIGRCSIAKKR